MKLKNILSEKDLPNKKWVKASAATLKEWQEVIYELIELAYEDIGGHPNYQSPSDINLSDGQWFEIIDVDGDGDPDAVNIAKKRAGGNKLVGLGHDGSREAKREVISHKVHLLSKVGYYIEVSGKMFKILKDAGIPIIEDEELVRKTLKGKQIEWLEGGWYKRKLGPKWHEKVMMGFPRP